jgi:hypothetical protein
MILLPVISSKFLRLLNQKLAIAGLDMLMVDAPAAAESCSRRHREEWVDGHFGPRLLWALWAVIILGLPILFPSLPFPLLCSIRLPRPLLHHCPGRTCQNSSRFLQTFHEKRGIRYKPPRKGTGDCDLERPPTSFS